MITRWLASIFGWRFDLAEFLLGLVGGVFLGLLARNSRPLLENGIRWGQSRVKEFSEGFTTGAADRYRAEVMRRAETLHLARALFVLDEIVLTPRLLPPPPPTDPLKEEPPREDTLAVLPNLPDWSVLSGIYRGPSLGLPAALASGANLLITGELGSGKSTALAFLAVRASKRDAALGGKDAWVPVLVHAADLAMERAAENDPLEALLPAVQRTVSAGLAQRLPGFLRAQVHQGHVLLLLDGLDELAPQELSAAASWLRRLLGKHPAVRVVAAGPAHGHTGITQAGLAPVPLAPWGEHERRAFLARWSAAWSQRVARGRMADLDPALISGWLTGMPASLTPMEVTLRAWAAFAGDVRGTRCVDQMESYLARFVAPEEAVQAQSVALSWIASRSAAVAEHDLRRGLQLQDLIDAGILVRRSVGRLAFAHPLLGSYLAARAMLEAGPPEPVEVPEWLPLEHAYRTFAALGDVGPLVQRYIQASGQAFELPALACARWLRDAPRKAPWRNDVLRALAVLLQDDRRPYGLRLRALHALAHANESSANILLRRLLTSAEPSSRIVGALGLGALRDADAVPMLLKLAERDPELLARQAVCLALAAIGTQAALEGLGRALLEGDETIRLAAAEALACHPDEGYGMLRDALELDRLLTRRAAVFGLARIPEPWAVELLEKIQIDDDEWVVRGAAAEALERRRNPPWKIHPPVRDPAQLPWVVAYAARHGMGVASGRAAMEMLRRALNNGSVEEKLAALEALGWPSGEELSLELFEALRSDDAYLRDTAFESLSRLFAAGIRPAAPVPQPGA